MRNVRWWFVFFLLTAVGAHGVDPPGVDLGDNLVRITSLPYPPAPSRPIASVTLLYCLLSMWWSCYSLYISVQKIFDRTLSKTACFFLQLNKNSGGSYHTHFNVLSLVIPLRAEAASYRTRYLACVLPMIPF